MPAWRIARAAGDSRRDMSGMTLVELLVVLTLLGLLSVVMFGSLRFGVRSWEAVHGAGQGRDDVTLVQGFLRDRLRDAILLPSGPDGPELQVAFTGEETAVAFVAPWLVDLGQGALFEFRLEQRDDAMVLSWKPNELSEDIELEPEGEIVGERILMGGIRSLSFRYYGTLEDGDDDDWYADWSEPGSAPRLVELTLVFEKDGAPHWPRFVAALPDADF